MIDLTEFESRAVPLRALGVAVSYTHLDVYKRQVVTILRTGCAEMV